LVWPGAFPVVLRCAAGPIHAAVRCYPDQKWLLLWRAYIVEKYEPDVDAMASR
jgi:hypothetical protein